MSSSTYVVLEKKAVPEHLKEISGLDVPNRLDDMIRALEDHGEAWDDVLCYNPKGSSSGLR